MGFFDDLFSDEDEDKKEKKQKKKTAEKAVQNFWHLLQRFSARSSVVYLRLFILIQ